MNPLVADIVKAIAREMAADEFFQGMLTTARRHDELVEEVRYPLHLAGNRYAFAEVSRRHGDFAIVACAAVAGEREVRLAVGGVADRPRVLSLPRLPARELESAINDFAWELDAQDDPHATAVYRRHLVRRLGQRVIEEAAR